MTTKTRTKGQKTAFLLKLDTEEQEYLNSLSKWQSQNKNAILRQLINEAYKRLERTQRKHINKEKIPTAPLGLPSRITKEDIYTTYAR